MARRVHTARRATPHISSVDGGGPVVGSLGYSAVLQRVRVHTLLHRPEPRRTADTAVHVRACDSGATRMPPAVPPSPPLHVRSTQTLIFAKALGIRQRVEKCGSCGVSECCGRGGVRTAWLLCDHAVGQAAEGGGMTETLSGGTRRCSRSGLARFLRVVLMCAGRP